MLRFSADGTSEVRGTVHSRDDTSHTVLIAETLPNATCADSDGDGTAGITVLQVAGRNPETGDEVLMSVAAGDHDLDERGEYDVRLEVGNLTTSVTLDVLPLPAGPPDSGVR